MSAASPSEGATPRQFGFLTVVYRSDPRFSFAIRPAHAASASARPRGVLVAVHGSERSHLDFLHAFAELATRHDLVVLAPLFPANVLGDGNQDGYKFLEEGDIRYDLMLLGMLQQAAGEFGCDADRFLLHGYSGGAQFAHRFALLHPDRLRAVSVAAPGEVTLADEHGDWWAGVRDVPVRLGRHIDWAGVAQLGWHLMVGERDVDTSELKEQPPSTWWKDDVQRLQANRIDRLLALRRSLYAQGVATTLDLMPGVAHGAGRAPAAALAQSYFARHLAGSGG